MSTWVYYLINRDHEVIYVGSTKNPVSRIASHENTSFFFAEVHNIRLVGPMSKVEADLLEGREILRLGPKHNKNRRAAAVNELCGPHITKGDYNAMQKKASAPRVNRIKKLRRAGFTWQAIAEQIGVSRQRVQQLAGKK